MKTQLISIVITVLLITEISCDSCKGCVELDEINFHKVIKRFPASIVKFDVAFPYGEKHEAFEKFSKEVSSSSELLTATVGVKDYGEHENEALAKSYSINKEDYPVLLLFKEDLNIPVKFTEEFSAENIIKFVKRNSYVYIGLPGCIEEFDKLVVKFMLDKEKDNKFLEKVDMLIKQQKEEFVLAANTYKLIINKVIERGDKFIGHEIARVKNLLDGKLGAKKMSELYTKLNILQTFSNTLPISDKEEL